MIVTRLGWPTPEAAVDQNQTEKGVKKKKNTYTKSD